MKNIRRKIRDTASRGNWEYGTVEEIANNQVTVILQGGKKRLTNLPLVGENVQIGDTVIVDFSTEIPIVSRYTLDIDDTTSLELAPETLPRDNEQFERPNVGFCAGISNGNCYTEDMQRFGRSVEYKLPYGRFELVGYDWPVVWDTSNFIKTTPLYGQPWITIPTTGRYFAKLFWEVDAHLDQFRYDLARGPIRMRLMDGTTPLLMAQTRTCEYSSYKIHNLHAFDIVSLEAGDILHVELWHSWENLWCDYYGYTGIGNNDYVIYCWNVDIDEGPLVVLQLIPGTEA